MVGSSGDRVMACKPTKKVWKIKVKIVRLWKRYSDRGIESIEMVLLDASGDTIHATVGRELVPQYEPFLEEGDTKIMINFIVSHASGSYRTTRHPYSIQFISTTRLCFCEEFSYRFTGLKPVGFNEILGGLHSPEYLVDIIGHVVEVSHLQIVAFHGKDTEKIAFVLRNQEGVRLPVVVWGKLALELRTSFHLLADKTLICVMRFAMIKVWQDDRSVCNVYDVSSIALNPDIKDVEDFIAGLPNSKMLLTFVDPKPLTMVSTISDEEKFFVRTPQKTISNILETRQVERCFLFCTIAAIETDLGWYYMSCKVCGQKVETLHNNNHKDGIYELDIRFKAYCTTCKILNPTLLPRYKLNLGVVDDTDHTKLLLLDDIVFQVIHQHYYPPLSHKSSKGPSLLEIAKANLVGKTFLFKVIVDNENYMFKDDTFKVVKVITSPHMINAFDVCAYPKGSCDTFGPQCQTVVDALEDPIPLSCMHSQGSPSTSRAPAKRSGSLIERLEASTYKVDALAHQKYSMIKKEKNAKSG